MIITMTELTYRFDAEGKTTQVEVGYGKYDGVESFNARVVLKAGENDIDLEKANKLVIDAVARKELRTWTTNVAVPPTEPETPVEDPEV